jgi:hypothetical protein
LLSLYFSESHTLAHILLVSFVAPEDKRRLYDQRHQRPSFSRPTRSFNARSFFESPFHRFFGIFATQCSFILRPPAPNPSLIPLRRTNLQQIHQGKSQNIFRLENKQHKNCELFVLMRSVRYGHTRICLPNAVADF